MRSFDFNTKGRTAALLLAGDLLALLLFVYFGQREHQLIDTANPLLGLLFPTALFAIPWIVSAVLLGSYQANRGIKSFMARALNTWLVAAPLALLLRAYILERAAIPTAFITAALGFGGLMILGWRLAFVLLQGWLRRRRSEFTIAGAEATSSRHGWANQSGVRR